MSTEKGDENMIDYGDNNELIELLKKRQRALELNNTQFANYIGISRAWLVRLYNVKLPRTQLKGETIAKFVERIAIPYEVMERYNKSIVFYDYLNKEG